MTPEDELKLSFYEELSTIKKSHNISLVRRIDTGEIFIKKTYENYPSDVFDVLKENTFQGIPIIHERIEDQDTGKVIIIEEYINGKSLSTMLDQEGALPESQTISIAICLCDILAPLHRNNPSLIHRDIKPSNVIITEKNEVYLVDFDASRLYDKSLQRDTELLGTDAYAAPEQYGFLQSDPRTDIYALGVLIREMLTGSSEKTSHSCGSLDDVIKKCTRMDPDDRYQNTIELKLALIKHIEPKPEPETMINSYALPGFRGHSITFKIFSALMYIMMTYTCFSYTEDGMSPADLWVNRIALFIAFSLCVLLYGNYMDVKHSLPLIRSDKIIVKVLGYATYTFCIIFVFGTVAVMADTFL